MVVVTDYVVNYITAIHPHRSRPRLCSTHPVHTLPINNFLCNHPRYAPRRPINTSLRLPRPSSDPTHWMKVGVEIIPTIHATYPHFKLFLSLSTHHIPIHTLHVHNTHTLRPPFPFPSYNILHSTLLISFSSPFNHRPPTVTTFLSLSSPKPNHSVHYP